MTTPCSQLQPLDDILSSMAQEANADLFLLVGDIFPGLGRRFLDLCVSSPLKEAENCMLLLSTRGGQVDEAYRLARRIQQMYQGGTFTVVADNICKSAGTLIALGADVLILGENAELGPLDTQVIVRDEFGEYQSGLIDADALQILQSEVFANFRQHFSDLLSLGGGELTAPTALRVASDLTLGLFGGIYSQINPIRFGERGRAVQVALEYGRRVSRENVREGTLERLTTGYPSHEFVIDRVEAADLFFEVNSPTHNLDVALRLMQPLVDYFASAQDPILANVSRGLPDNLSQMLEILISSPQEMEASESASTEETETLAEQERESE